MRKIKKFIPALSIIALLSSCAIHTGNITGNAQLNNTDFKIVGFVSGTSESSKVLGIGGTGKESLVLDAKNNLYENNPLKQGQALSNVAVDFCYKYYFVYSKTKVTVSAEIVDFVMNREPDNKADNELLSTDNFLYSNGYSIGDSVYTLRDNVYAIAVIQKFNQDGVVVQYSDSDMEELEFDNIYKLQNIDSKTKFFPGDKVKVSIESYSVHSDNEILVDGLVMAIGRKNSFLVKYTLEGTEKTELIKQSRLKAY